MRTDFPAFQGDCPTGGFPFPERKERGRLCRRKQHGDSTGVGHSGTAAAFLTAFSVLDKECSGEIPWKRMSWQRQREDTSTPEGAGVSTGAVQFQGK